MRICNMVYTQISMGNTSLAELGVVRKTKIIMKLHLFEKIFFQNNFEKKMF